MDRNSIESAKQRYEFESWRGTNLLGREIERRSRVVPKNLLPDMELLKIREIDPGDGTRLVQAAWSTGASTVAIDLRECDSLEQAQEIVVELLANLQAPDIDRMEKPIGDISFGRSSMHFVIFARGNVAVMIRNAGDELITVDSYARQVDDWIVSYED